MYVRLQAPTREGEIAAGNSGSVNRGSFSLVFEHGLPLVEAPMEGQP
jgi:hypothetical protein